MEQLLDLDKKLFLLFNGYHTLWLDQVMYHMSNTYFWLPLHGLLLYLTYISFKKYSWVPLASVALAIGLANTITSEIMKPIFLRLRPSHDPGLKDMVHIVNNYKGGLYGFASSHAANTFALAVFFFLLFETKYRYASLLFVWAAIVTYTRVYLGVHYPGDVLIGGAIGMICGWLCFLATKRILKTPEGNSPQSINI